MGLRPQNSNNIVLDCINVFQSFCAGSQASPQDRFLVMAAEMDNVGSQELAQFWKEVPKANVMEHRYKNKYVKEFVHT